MEKDFALKLAAQIGIDVQQVVREEAELIFLKGLLESSFSDRLVFKGGTALRLVYESPRFSEDLDFSLTGKITLPEFEKVISRIVRNDERFSIRDLASKYYTYLAEIRIKEPWQDTAFGLKIEISKRISVEREGDCINELAKSNSTNISIMTKVFSLEKIMQDKLRAVKERKMPRDVFDIWYICKKTGKPFGLRDFGYPKGKIGQELRKFLPKSFYAVAEDLEKLNAQGL
jgi:predicted nucleotidyltransferase component of viral defense system